MFEIAELDLVSFAKEMGVDLNTLCRLFNIYCQEVSEALRQLHTHLENRNMEKLGRTAHNIKGISANLYLHRMYKASERLQIHSKEPEFEVLEKDVRIIESVFRTTCTDMAVAFEAHNLKISIE